MYLRRGTHSCTHCVRMSALLRASAQWATRAGGLRSCACTCAGAPNHAPNAVRDPMIYPLHGSLPPARSGRRAHAARVHAHVPAPGHPIMYPLRWVMHTGGARSRAGTCAGTPNLVPPASAASQSPPCPMPTCLHNVQRCPSRCPLHQHATTSAYTYVQHMQRKHDHRGDRLCMGCSCADPSKKPTGTWQLVASLGGPSGRRRTAPLHRPNLNYMTKRSTPL